MKRILLTFSVLSLLASPAAAQSVLFDFNTTPYFTPLPIDLTEGQITASFSGTGQSYSIQIANIGGITPAGFSGNMLRPNGVSRSDLLVSFSQALQDASIMYAPSEQDCGTSATMRITGYMNSAFVATSTTTAPVPGTWPTGVLTLSSLQGFDSVVIHYEAAPACGNSGPVFVADNMMVTPLPPAEPITWERFIGTEAVSNTLLRPTGTGWNAGAVSNRVLVSGDGYADYTVPATAGYAMFGLSHGDTDVGYADIDYALYTYPVTGQLLAYEKGVHRGTFGPYAQGDRLRVSVEGGVVTYRRNGQLLGSSAVLPTYPLLADTSLYSAGTELLDARMAGQLQDRADAFWRKLVRTTASGPTLTRETSVGWNGGASSAQELASGDGYTEYRVSSASDYVMFGLSHGDTDAGYADVDYAIYTYPPTGRVLVYEGGAYRATLGSYAVNDILRVGVEGGVVTYSVNGWPLYSSTPPTYPLVTDTSLYSANATVSAAKMGGELREIVSWTHLNGVEVTGDALTRPVAGGWTAGAISSRRIAAGSGGAEYAVADTASEVMFGLSKGDTDGSDADIDYAIYTNPVGQLVMVMENGVSRGSFGPYNPGDRLRVSVGDGVVSYWRNGVLLYTSLTVATYPLILDVSLYAGRIEGARLTGNLSSVVEESLVWTNLVNVSDSGGTLQRPAGSGWNAGAVSTQTLTGDGYVEYQVSSPSDYVMFGLGTGDSNQGYADIEYAIYTYPPTGRVLVYEGGAYRGSLASYAAGDRLKVSVEGGLVKYRKNGVLVYSSAIAPTYPLNVDTSLYSMGATVLGAKIGREE